MILLQLNWYIKHMNKGNVSENRICWTAESLNSSLDIHKDISDLQISQTNRQNVFVRGTISDLNIICQFITQKTEKSNGKSIKSNKWDSKYWSTIRDDSPNVGRPSNTLEEAFSSIGDYYLSNQNMWDNAEQVEEASDDDSEDEPGEEEE